MVSDQKSYQDRARAESFGSVAEAYDRFRPSYPDALIDDITEMGAERVLDVACGTGKLAVPLLACGMAVLGVEIDPEMAAIARAHGLIVEIGAFETWDDDGRTFDLITCGQGWHWIDPDEGGAKAKRLLNPGGALLLAWNHEAFEDELKSQFQAVLAEHAPEILADERARENNDEDLHVQELKESGPFAHVEKKHYKWAVTLTSDEWVGRLATNSAYIRLPDEQRQRVLDGMRAVVDAKGGSFTSHYGTVVVIASVSD